MSGRRGAALWPPRRGRARTIFMSCDPKDPMSTLRCALWTLVLLSSTSALAAGNLYAVMPTQGVGAAAEVFLVGQTMHLALQEQSLALVPVKSIEAGVAAEVAACGQSVVACGRLVGARTGATHVVLSELWDQAGLMELKVAIVDVRTDLAPQWHSHRTANPAELGPLAKWAVLDLVVPAAVAGRLAIEKLEAGADIVVNGMVRDRTPMIAPLKLIAGRHDVEIRLGTKTPFRQSVVIEAERTTVLNVCVRGDALSVDCAEAAPFPVLTTVGGVAVVAAAASGGVALLSFMWAEDAHNAFIADQSKGDDSPRLQTIGAVAGVTAGVLVVGGAAAITVGLLTE